MTHDEDRQNLISERENCYEELTSRNNDIEVLNAEITELKTTIVNYDTLHKTLNKEIKELKEQLEEKTYECDNWFNQHQECLRQKTTIEMRLMEAAQDLIFLSKWGFKRK